MLRRRDLLLSIAGLYPAGRVLGEKVSSQIHIVVNWAAGEAKSHETNYMAPVAR